MAGQANWPGTPVDTHQPGGPALRQIVAPQPSQAPGQTPDQAALTAEQLRAARLANDATEGVDIPGNIALQGPEYLASLPPADQEMVRGFSEGRLPFPTGRALNNAHMQSLLAAVGHYDPNFDAANYGTRLATRRSFTSGRRAQNITSLNTVLHHIEGLQQAATALHNGDFRAANAIGNYFANQFGAGAPMDFDTAAGPVSDEMEAAIVNSGGTLAGRQGWRDLLRSDASPEQFTTAFRRMASLLHDRIDEIGQEYNNGMGRSDDPIRLLSPSAREAYFRLQGIPAPVENNQNGAPGDAPPGGGAPSSGSPPVVNGPQGGIPPRVHPSAGPGFEAASSDTPPESVVTPEYIHMAGELQGAFDHGATREQMDALAQRRGLPPFSADLDAAIAYRDRGGRGARILPPETATPAGTRAQQLNETQGREGAGGLLMHGATLGLTDEASGVGGALYNAMKAPFTGNFDPVGEYQTSRDAERIRLNEARDSSGWGGTAAEIVGSLASVNPVEAVETVAPTLMARMGAGGRSGAIIGAGSGFGHGSGLGGSIRGAIEGGAEGGAVGVAAPVAGAVVRGGGRLARGAYRTVMGENPSLARQIIAGDIAADDARGFNPVARVSGQLADAHANDVPAMLADTGDNVRGRLAAAARASGPTRTAARDALDARQAGMVERVTNTIERDLGPVSNPHEVADASMTRARDTAAPLYDSAYAATGADTFAQRVAPLLSRPSMQRATQRALRIAQEEGRDPTTAGFDVNSSGEVTVSRTPSWQTLDYVKRGMDDVIEQYRDTTTGRLHLDTEGRAINNTQRSFLRAFDSANPDYAAARSAYGGPVRGVDAMNQGRQALSMTADDLEARMRDMTPYEREMFALGTRRAMAELIASKGDTADVVHALVGTGKKRAMLARLFGDRQGFQRFIDTLGHEQEAFRTFKTARLGSPTAANLQDDNALRDAATEGATDLVLNGGTGILPSAVKFVTSLGRRRLDEQTAKEMTALLSESDPARLRELASELRQEQTRQATLATRRVRTARRGGVVAGGAAGRTQER